MAAVTITVLRFSASLSKTWLYAGKSEHPALLALEKGSDNMSGADDQQERLKTVGWIVGFVDGEGCFSVTIQKSTTATGWQVFPEFVVTQGEKSLSALHDPQAFFGCGKIFVNRRRDNHRRSEEHTSELQSRFGISYA